MQTTDTQEGSLSRTPAQGSVRLIHPINKSSGILAKLEKSLQKYYKEIETQWHVQYMWLIYQGTVCLLSLNNSFVAKT